MKKISVKRIIIIISIIIFCLGILSAIEVSNSIESSIPSENVNIDGSDFSGLFQITGIIGSKIIGLLIVLVCFFIDLIIWIIYEVILIIVNIYNNQKIKHYNKK